MEIWHQEQHPSQEHTIAAKSVTADEFRAAIGTSQLSLHYQPILDLRNRQVKGFEALMRWAHPQKGPIPPDIFIPLAEDSGLITEASRWALLEACRALTRLQGRTGLDPDIFMSVNFTPADFAEENFLEQLYTVLSDTDLEPRRLNLEITEHLLMHYPQQAVEILGLCRRAGINITVDDLGCGTAPLSHLTHYPVNMVKIDRNIVYDMLSNEDSMQMAGTIIALGQAMKAKIIAAGVEGQQTADALLSMGCDMAQGFHFSRPLSEHSLTDLLMEWRKTGKLY